jgi:hypothetical protein
MAKFASFIKLKQWACPGALFATFLSGKGRKARGALLAIFARRFFEKEIDFLSPILYLQNMEIENLAAIGLGEVFPQDEMPDNKAWLEGQAADCFRDAVALDSRGYHVGAAILSREGNRLIALAAKN